MNMCSIIRKNWLIIEFFSLMDTYNPPPQTSYFWVQSIKLAENFAAAKSLQSCPTLCDPIDGSPPGCPVPGILQARTLEWVVISFSNAWKWKVKMKPLSHVWLLATYCSLLGSSVHGILQAKVLEWGAIAFSSREVYIPLISPFCHA